MFFSQEERWALTLSTFAGLSTTFGAAFAVIKKPDDALLAFLLGTAIGVMLMLSVAEMWVHNAMQHGWPGVSAAVLGGALLYQIAQPFLPDFVAFDDAGDEQPGEQQGEDKKAQENVVAAAEPTGSGEPGKGRKKSAGAAATARQQANGTAAALQRARDVKQRARSAELLRLGLLMAFTMTLHNFPEGFAVAFASFTDFGPVMAAAIAVHNIPEGIIVAAPVYAATGSRWKALLVATLSGLSEPLGALIALVAVRPWLSEALLHYILAFAGGIMAAVCVLELWPEARKCRADRRLAAGVALGGGAMAWTLWVGV